MDDTRDTANALLDLCRSRASAGNTYTFEHQEGARRYRLCDKHPLRAPG